MIVLQVMFSRGLGGLERAYLDHATLLAARGHRVHCLVYDDAQSRAELEQALHFLRQREQVRGLHQAGAAVVRDPHQWYGPRA